VQVRCGEDHKVTGHIGSVRSEYYLEALNRTKLVYLYGQVHQK
jgi:hypothetical protein